MKTVLLIGYLVLIISVFAIPIPVQAGLVICGSSQNDPNTSYDETRSCTPCLILEQVNTVINYLTGTLVPIVAGVLFLLGGAMIILGGASPELLNRGKSMLTMTVIGVVIIYGSYLVANTILNAIAGDSDVAKSWFKIECVGGAISPGATPGPRPSGSTVPAGELTPFGFRNAVSPELTEFKSCLEGRLSRSDYTLTSTTDRNITSGLCDPLDPNERFGVAEGQDGCQHARNSCHYGGRSSTCRDRGSYALDYVGNYDKIRQAAPACNAGAFVNHEYPGTSKEHMHISIGGVSGCGCDE